MKFPRIINLRKTSSNWGFTWSGFIFNKKGEWFLLLQVIFICLHLLPRWPYLNNDQFILIKVISLIGIIILFLGLIITSKGLLDLGRSLSPLPEPIKGASLIRHGIYKHSRHPIYSGIILCSAGITIYKSSLLHLILLFSLTVVLIFKARREERKLKEIHSDYKDYSSITSAILSIPKYQKRK